MNVRKTWKLRLSAIVLIALVFFMQMIEIKASENEKFPLAEITDFAYIKDSTGTYMGAKDYAVLGKTTYLLLDKENTLLVLVYESTTGGNRDRVTTNVYTQATLVAEGYKPYSYNGFAD